ncbi:NADH-quinone oxidoreductase subunit NuoN [Cupriavidus metallidurans]|mgnify:FL=1|uniref:NADH-quinone oxidoreductase subunit N n=1 Tax=Cupriavidus metallidurans (strain ATCC 43123 / DSM 2839 / NBRC 102507 / CH34) TaxID=266264 RepID=Q1LPV0_CUPMC|nr:NADH-quinone oxidoreductase subunit NuoN [Cupriavidus metallidurans]ABF07826.1 NADH:ubiquinone oxidoreductase, membrane subunit N [Cupriavidus metallidurans CH34]QGS27880.1 NADH-quinone oxidoreductase subunit NuoN [Cupriavidus metallidurans]
MQSSSSLAPVAPIIFLAIAIAAINWIDLARGKNRTSVAYPLSLLTTLVLTAWFGIDAAGGETHYAFANLVVIDPMANVLAAFCSLGMLLTLIYTRSYLAERDMFAGEFYMLALFTLGGQIVMITGNNFLTLYLGLELLSLSSYALVALRRDSRVTSESAIKYFVLGALASGFLLYGMSMMYGATGSLNLGEVFRVVESGRVNTTMLAFGVVFIVAGVAFKLGAAPFHMWIPDIYQGSPTAVTLLIAAGPKVAAFALIIRLLVEGLLPLATDWQVMLVILSIASLVIGNLTAIVQTNLKRMLAYSTISHMGFVLLGMLSGVVANKADGAVNAYSSSMFYSITYMLTTLGTFGLILVRTRKGFEAETLDDLKGMSRRHPWFAFLMLVMMFSMAGIPPTVGFYAKLSVLQAVVSAGMSWLAVLAVVFSLIGAFYYLRIVKLMYFDAPVGEEPLEASTGLRSVLSLNGLAVILLGLFPAGLMDLCFQAIRATLAS